MISKKELLERILRLEREKPVLTSRQVVHYSTELSSFKDPSGNLGSYYPEVGNLSEIIDALVKFCGIEFKTIPPTEKRIEVVKKLKK